MSSSEQGDQQSTEAVASDAGLPDTDSPNPSSATTELPAITSDGEATDHLEEEKPRGPIRKTLGIISTVFWSLIILAAVVFVWPPTWGGPITVTVVQGHSMEPVYYTGDVVIAVRNYSNEYAVGDTIVYKVEEGDLVGMVIHRIIKQLPNGNYITQGDNKAMADPWEVIPSNVFGKAAAHIPDLAKWLGLVRTPMFIGIIVGVIVIWVLWPRSDEEEDEDDEADTGGDEGKERDGEEASMEEDNTERSPNP